jgi:hypothetical protein
MSTPVPIATDSKPPASVLDYGIDLSIRGWLTGDEIISSFDTDFLCETDSGDTGLTLSDFALDGDALRMITRISDGTDDADYIVRFHWVTSTGQEHEKWIRIKIRK